MMVKEGYKKVEIGPKNIIIPEEWDLRPLKEIAEKGKKNFVDGDWVTSSDMVKDGEYQLIQLGNIGEGNFKGAVDKFVDQKFFNENNCTLVETGDLLISRMASPVLRTIIVPDFNKKSITSVDIVIAKVNEKEWDKKFIMYMLNSKNWKDLGEIYATGSTRKRISRKNIEKLKAVFPSRSEQKKIAAILSSVDETIEKTDQVIEKTKELKKGLMQQLLTKGIGHDKFKEIKIGPVIFKIPEIWEIDILNNLTNKITDIDHKMPDKQEKGVPFLAVGNLTQQNSIDLKNVDYISKEDYIKHSKKFDPQKGDLLYSRFGTIGYSRVIDFEDNFIASYSIVMISPDRNIISNYFLNYWLNFSLVRKGVRTYVKGSANRNLNLSDIKDIIVALPPLEEQKKIANILSTVDEKIQKEEDYKSKLERLKKGLMQKLLTGEIRV